MRPAFQSVNQGGHELINLEKNKQQSIILETLDRVNKNWQALAIKLLNTTAKFDELQEQSEKFYSVYKSVTVWLDNIEVRLVSIPPVGLDPDVLSSQMKEQKVIKPRLWLLVREEYVSVKCISGGGEGRGGEGREKDKD